MDTSDVGISLFSRAVTSQVFSAPLSLTSVFGMGTGGPSASSTPTIQFAFFQEHLLLYHFVRNKSRVFYNFFIFSDFYDREGIIQN